MLRRLTKAVLMVVLFGMSVSVKAQVSCVNPKDCVSKLEESDLRRVLEDNANRDRERLERQRKNELKEQERRSRLKQGNASSAQEILERETPCFDIRKIEVKLNERDQKEDFGQDMLDEQKEGGDLFGVKQYQGQCLGVKGLKLVERGVQSWLIERGLSTSRAWIEKQNLKSGVLVVDVMFGRIGELRLMNREKIRDPGKVETVNERVEEGKGWLWAFPIKAGEVLDSKQLGRGVETMQQERGQKVELYIEPSQKEAGFSDAVIKREWVGKGYQTRMGLDNSGSKRTGGVNGNVSVVIEDLTGRSDDFTVSTNRSMQNTRENDSKGSGVSYRLPVGWYTATFSANQNTYYQEIEGNASWFVTSGEGWNWDIKQEYVLWKGADDEWVGSFRVGHNRASGYIDNLFLDTQQQHITQGELGVSWQGSRSYGQLNAELSRKQSLKWGSDTDYRWALWQLDLGYENRFRLWGDASEKSDKTQQSKWDEWGGNWRYRVDGRYQREASELRYTSTECLNPYPASGAVPAGCQGYAYIPVMRPGASFFGIGNRWTVRGFDGEQSLAAARGFTIRQELSHALAKQDWLKDQNVVLAWDLGKVWGEGSEYLSGHTLAGLATGLRGSLGRTKSVSYEVLVARAVVKPTDYETSKWDLIMNVSWNF